MQTPCSCSVIVKRFVAYTVECCRSVVRQNVVCSTVSDITACPVKHKPHTVDTLCFRTTEALEQLQYFCVPQIAVVPSTCEFVGVSVPALQSNMRVNDPKFEQHVCYFDLLTFIYLLFCLLVHTSVFR